MVKQRTYTGTKKGTSLARQGKRSKLVGGGTVKTTAPQQEKESKISINSRSSSFKKAVDSMAICFIIVAVLALYLVVSEGADMSVYIRVPIIIALVAIIVILAVIIVRKNRKSEF